MLNIVVEQFQFLFITQAMVFIHWTLNTSIFLYMNIFSGLQQTYCSLVNGII